MRVVYVAEDIRLAGPVAMNSATPPENTLYRARFLREARAASALNHPHIAGIYDYSETRDGQPLISYR
jgi:eukaryotic-like serine/threonine-protein kinase